MNMVFKAAAGAALFVGALASPAFAESVVHVTLSDVGGDIDFSKAYDLGVGGKGDMGHAPVNLKADVATVPAGKVTFEVTNVSKEIEHEMVVSMLPSADAVPPFKAADNEIDEDAAQAIGEVPETEPGKTGSVTLDLKPGYYVLYCNIAGHYGAGMWTKIEVQ